MSRLTTSSEALPSSCHGIPQAYSPMSWRRLCIRRVGDRRTPSLPVLCAERETADTKGAAHPA